MHANTPASPSESDRHFRNQHQIRLGRRQRRLAGEKTRMPAHQLDQADAVARGHRLDARAADHVDCGRIGADETETAIDERHVVVYRLGHPDYADAQTAPLDLRAYAHCPVHAAVAADHEQDADAIGFQVVDQFRGFLRSARGAQYRSALVMDVRDRFGRERQREMTIARDQPLIAVAKAEDLSHAVACPQFQHDAAHHVVEAGRQTAAGDDAAAHGARVEEYLVARPGQLERRQRREIRARSRQAGQRIVEQHLVGSADEMHAALAQVAGNRRRQQAATEYRDRNIARRQPAHVFMGMIILGHDYVCLPLCLHRRICSLRRFPSIGNISPKPTGLLHCRCMVSGQAKSGCTSMGHVRTISRRQIAVSVIDASAVPPGTYIAEPLASFPRE